MNNNVLKGTNSKILLIGKIKGLAQESKRTRQRLLNSKSEKRTWQCAYTKRIVGLDIRHHLLAYAFLRGDTYSKLEQKCRPEHAPNAEHILQIVHAHVPSYQVKAGTWTLEKINSWLKAGV